MVRVSRCAGDGELEIQSGGSGIVVVGGGSGSDRGSPNCYYSRWKLMEARE